jgi:hypothetical protein
MGLFLIKTWLFMVSGCFASELALFLTITGGRPKDEGSAIK